MVPRGASVELSRFPGGKLRNVILRCVYYNIMFYGAFITIENRRYVVFILEGCAQTAAVGDPVELVGLLFFPFS